MTANKLVMIALTYAGITQKDLAKKLNTTPQNLNQRLRTGKFTCEEWDQIARAIGAESGEVKIVFGDGVEFKSK